MSKSVVYEERDGNDAAAEEIEERFARLSELEPGWDSYGALPVAAATIDAARSVLAALAGPVCIYPTSGGGVGLSWAEDFVKVEIGPGELSASVGELYAESESSDS